MSDGDDWRKEAGIPRRNCIDLLYSEEKMIYDCVVAIEQLAPDERLTRAQIKLQEARDLVADFFDDGGSSPPRDLPTGSADK